MRGGRYQTVVLSWLCYSICTRIYTVTTGMRSSGGRGRRWSGESPRLRKGEVGAASTAEGSPSSLFWLLPLWDRDLDVSRLDADLASCRRCRVGGQGGLVRAVARGDGLHDATGDGGYVCVSERESGGYWRGEPWRRRARGRGGRGGGGQGGAGRGREGVGRG
jgi:hypothetical protein